MPNFGYIAALERFTRKVNRLFVLIASLLVVAIMLLTVREVVLRYGFNQPSLWGMDIARYALLYTFFLAVGPALESGHHVSVDLFDKVIPLRFRRYQPVVGYALTLFFATVLLRYVVELTIEVFQTGELSFSAVEIALKYIYWIGPIGVLQFWLTAFVGLARSWQLAMLDPAASHPMAER